MGHMRQLGMYAAVLVVTTGVASAGPWSEFGAGEPLRPAQSLVESSCDISVEIRGGIAEVELSQRISNTGAVPMAATTEFELPEGAQLIGLSLQRGKGTSEAAIPVTAWKGTERVTAEKVLGADPAIVTALHPSDAGRPRYRAVIQPLAPDAELTFATRWTSAVDIRDGSLRVMLPGRGDGAGRCKGLIDVKPGPGARVERIRLDGADLGIRSTATFEHGASDSRLAAVLAFAKPQPLVWTQSMPLGAGAHAQAITIVTPAVKAANARRALLVIDGSRSMELVGRHNVQRLVRELGSALPAKSEIEAVVFDRKPTRILGGWKPATSDNLTKIQEAVRTRTATNGSDTAAALAFAHSLIGDARGQTLIILITDGVLGDVAPDALTKAIPAGPVDLDVHAIVLAPGRMTAPDASALKATVNYFGGSYIEVPTKEIDTAISSIDSWLRPAWQELALTGTDLEIPEQLRAGTGIVLLDVVKKPATVALDARGTTKIKAKATKGPTAPLAHLALAAPGGFDEMSRATLRERHPSVDDQHAFVVLSSSGTVAANRRAMIAGGGPYTRMVDVDDPPFPADVRIGQTVVIGGSAMDRQTVTVLLRQYLQPSAFVCYQKALGQDGNLAGTAQFKLEIGRGELTRAHVTGIGNATFDACLLDAAYNVTPPLPNPDFNTDDRTIVNYPLTFSVRESKPFVVAGDADSSSPLDIDSIQGGPPIAKKKGHVEAGDTSTPLGGLRPPPTK